MPGPLEIAIIVAVAGLFAGVSYIANRVQNHKKDKTNA